MRWPDGFMWGSGASSTQAEAAVRLGQTGAPVASIFGLSDVRAMDDTPETTRLAGLLNDLNWRAGLELFRDGILRVPALDPVERPDLAGSST